MPRRRLSEDEQRAQWQAAGSHGTGFVSPPAEGFAQAPSVNRGYVDVRRERGGRQEAPRPATVRAPRPATGSATAPATVGVTRPDTAGTTRPASGGARRSPASALLIGAYVVVIAIACVVIWVFLGRLVSF